MGRQEEKFTLSPCRLVTLSPNLRAALPRLALAFGVTSASMSAIFVRWADAPGAVNGFYRMATAALLMTIPLVVQLTRRSSSQAMIRELRAPRSAWLAAFAGMFFAINLALWNTGALVTLAANAMLLGNTSVLWVPLATWLVFKRRLRPMFWGGLALALLGAIVILGQDLLLHPAFGVGDLFALSGSFVYSAYLLIMERVRAKLSTLIAWWISTAASALTLFALALIFQQPLTGYTITTYAIFVATALIVQMSGFLSLSYALGHLPASLVSSSLLAQPVISAFLAIPLLGQSVGAVQAIGGALVLAGIFIVHKSKG
ncbi:MAG: DMT family transporter [Chloroflexota bacterium]